MNDAISSAHTTERDAVAVVAGLAAKLTVASPVAVLFFASHEHDGAAISAGLRAKYPSAEVIGCTTAGELTEGVSATGGVSALAIGRDKARRASAALARFGSSTGEGIRSATAEIATHLEIDLRDADPNRYVGIVLVEGLRMKEEAANEALGNQAPLLSFVGGSAGDNLEFKVTRVFCNGKESDDGAALLLLDVAVPFVIAKTCSFVPLSSALKVTRADVENRVIYELDGRPVLEVYAEALGKSASELSAAVFMTNPLGLMIDGKAWIRSPQQILPDGSLKLYCQVLEGTPIHVMQTTDLVEDTKSEMARVRESLGGTLSGGLAFNCILRRLELDERHLHEAFLETFAGTQMAGFHTYGESLLGHINQTLTGLWFA